MIDLFQIDTGSSLLLPFADEGIRAGFPSPAQDYMDIAIDLNHELITHPYSTFYGRVKGNSMEDAHVFDGDILVIDKSLEARDGGMAIWLSAFWMENLP
ncbi:umuD protein [Porphyromonas gingivalis]|nr:umuD protein [Porphyromonas gingivalis]